MNRTYFNKIVVAGQERMTQSLVKKGAEYANDGNVFHNFIQAAQLQIRNTTPEVALWGMLTKHIQSVRDLLTDIEEKGDSHLLTGPMINEKFGDLQNYSMLLEGMMWHRLKTKEDHHNQLSLDLKDSSPNGQ